jgi:hypothetical protein
MQTMNAQPDMTDARATLADYLAFWLLSMRLAALQWRARRLVRRGECGTVARLIAKGDWATLDSLTDGWSAP